jgi:hypothetical protein
LRNLINVCSLRAIGISNVQLAVVECGLVASPCALEGGLGV